MDSTENLRQNTYEMALDWLALGIRPVETILFVQSQVPEVMELHTYLSMVTPLGKLTDLPTFKDKVRENPNNVNYGLVGYPVLMTRILSSTRPIWYRWASISSRISSLHAKRCDPSIISIKPAS